ncbi:hypothetical protein ACVU7I_15040 [Patulibacter sp. S7RM1-6]
MAADRVRAFLVAAAALAVASVVVRGGLDIASIAAGAVALVVLLAVNVAVVNARAWPEVVVGPEDIEPTGRATTRRGRQVAQDMLAVAPLIAICVLIDLDLMMVAGFLLLLAGMETAEARWAGRWEAVHGAELHRYLGRRGAALSSVHRYVGVRPVPAGAVGSRERAPEARGATTPGDAA